MCWGGEAVISKASLVSALEFPDGGLEHSTEGPTCRIQVAVRDAFLPRGAVKWDSPAGHRVRRQVRREIVAYLQLKHPNLVPFLGVIIPVTIPESSPERHPLSIITLFAKKGSALDYLKERRCSAPTAFFEIVNLKL